MNTEHQIATLQEELASRIELTKVVTASLRKESKRTNSLLNRYKLQKTNDGILSGISAKSTSTDDIEQYAELVSKQFEGRMEELIVNYQTIKRNLEKLQKQYKLNSSQDYHGKIQEFRKHIQHFDQDFMSVWQKEHQLCMNYKLNIAAKELQRWTAVVGSLSTNQAIPNIIDQLFDKKL